MNNKRISSAIKKGIVTLALTLCFATGAGIVSNAEEKGTVTVETGKIRASADTNSQQVGSVAKGGNVDIVSKTTGADGKTWYQVYVDANTKGFIRADLVSVSDGANIKTTENTSSTQNTQTEAPAATTATAVDAKKGTVVTSNVRIRKGASTSHDVVATANRGMVVTVTGEADGADGKKWFQVSFSYNNKEITGFIRADLVSFDEVPADSEVTEITGEGTMGEGSGEEQDMTAESTDNEYVENPEESTSSSNNAADDVVLLNTEDIPYIQPEFTAVTLKWQEQQINAYKNGEFYIFYAQYNGAEGWYMFDSVNNTYQRYVYSQSESMVPSGKSAANSLVVIILVVIIVVLIAVVGLLFLKLREYSVEYVEVSDDDEEEGFEDMNETEFEENEVEIEEDNKKAKKSLFGFGRRQEEAEVEEMDAEEVEEIEEEPEEEIVEQPVRRRPEGQPMRRPEGQAPRRPEGQPMRRPEGQAPRRPEGQAPRRPEGQPMRRPEGQAPRRPEGQAPRRPEGQPMRRPEGQAPRRPEGQRPMRRPEGQAPRRPEGQRPMRRPENQPMPRGQKAKNFLENDDDGIDTFDL